MLDVPAFDLSTCGLLDLRLLDSGLWNLDLLMERVCIAMSGGVDSSVAAVLLRRQGFEVCGVTMKLFENKDKCESARSCCGYDSTRDARLVADSIGISHYTVNAIDVFRETVMNDFAAEYKLGRTPNPCVRCNRFVKFDYLMKKAEELGCRYLATGHYAKRLGNRLYKGADQKKDQAYFLYPIYGAAIERILFPVGDTTKEEIRRIAADIGLITAKRPESQDICFVQDGNYAALLDGTLAAVGPIVDISGKEVGRHQGIHRYTIGQRKGLGALGSRMFVKEIRVASNTVVIGAEDDLSASTVVTTDAIVAPGFCFDSAVEYGVQVRYRSKPAPARVSLSDSRTLHILFRDPVRAVAPGQSAVVYEGDMVVGGGIIERAG